MSAFFEFEGKTLKTAIKKASQKLNIPEEKIDHDVLSYGSTGIFGLVGAKKARIRVAVPGKSEGIQSKEKEGQKQKENAEATVSEPSETAEIIGDTIKKGKVTLQKIIELITESNQITVNQKENRVYYDIVCDKPALLIGKRGQTLDAIQYIVDKIVNNQREHRIKIQVDVEGYLKEKRKKLEGLAKKTAQKVKKGGKAISIGHMNSADRRIIHITLKNEKDIKTKSIGDGHVRKILILPQKKRYKQQRKKNE